MNSWTLTFKISIKQLHLISNKKNKYLQNLKIHQICLQFDNLFKNSQRIKQTYKMRDYLNQFLKSLIY